LYSFEIPELDVFTHRKSEIFSRIFSKTHPDKFKKKPTVSKNLAFKFLIFCDISFKRSLRFRFRRGFQIVVFKSKAFQRSQSPLSVYFAQPTNTAVRDHAVVLFGLSPHCRGIE